MFKSLFVLLVVFVSPMSERQYVGDGEAGPVDRVTVAVSEARALKGIYRVEEAIAVLSDAISRCDSVWTVEEELLRAELADCFFLNGDYPQSMMAYGQLHSKNPDKLMYAVRQMQCAYRMKDFPGAIAVGESIVRKDTIPAMVALVGDSFNQWGQADSALVWYNLALSCRPENPSVVSKAAKIFLDRKDYAAALAVSDSLLSLVPDEPSVSQIKGLALFLSGRYDDAIDVFERQEDLGNDSYPVHYYLGQSYWQAQVLYRAEKELLAAWQIDSSDVNLAYCIAAVKADGRRSFETEVRPWLDKALQMLEPDHSLMSRIHQQYGLGDYRRDRWNEAIAHYEEAWCYNPEYYSALSIIGYCYERQGDWRNALKWYEKYLSLAPRGTTSYEFVRKSVDIARAELHMQ